MGYLYLLCVALMFSFGGTCVKLISPYYAPEFITFFRFITGVILLLLLKLAKRQKFPENFGNLLRENWKWILFGATGDTITDSPVVHIVSARVVEMTAGKGTPYFGELATPELTVRGKTVSWNAVEHADSYSLVIKNELGALITRTLTETSFDFSILTVEEELRIEVTAMGANYYNSETAVVTFMLSNDSGEKKGCGCDSAIGASSAAAAVVVMALAVLLCKRRKTNHENI